MLPERTLVGSTSEFYCFKCYTYVLRSVDFGAEFTGTDIRSHNHGANNYRQAMEDENGMNFMEMQ